MELDVAAALAGRTVLVAEVDGSVAGVLVADVARGSDCDVDVLAVRPDAQGRGVGRALMGAVERLARRSGAARLTLYTNAAMAGALALYPKLSFIETGRSSASGFDRVHFAKPLGPAIAVKASVDALYGRRRVYGHGLDPAYERYALDLAAPFDLTGPVRMEVGFGSGEHLLDQARRAPDVTILGVEPFETGMRKVVRVLVAEGTRNVRLYLGDARRVIEWLPDAALTRVDVLYPAPWPKSRHWKRRFISTCGLDGLARVLRAGGEVRFASDVGGYVAWTRAHVAAHPAFALERDDAAPWPDWPGTRYEVKALREGRAPRYLTLRRA